MSAGLQSPVYRRPPALAAMDSELLSPRGRKRDVGFLGGIRVARINYANLENRVRSGRPLDAPVRPTGVDSRLRSIPPTRKLVRRHSEESVDSWPAPDVKEQLFKGIKVGDKTFKVHLDGHNITDPLAGKSPSP